MLVSVWNRMLLGYKDMLLSFFRVLWAWSDGRLGCCLFLCTLFFNIWLVLLCEYVRSVLNKGLLRHILCIGQCSSNVYGGCSLSLSSSSFSKSSYFAKVAERGQYIYKVTLSVPLCADHVPSIWRQAGSAAWHAHQHPLCHQGPAAV